MATVVDGAAAAPCDAVVIYRRRRPRCYSERAMPFNRAFFAAIAAALCYSLLTACGVHLNDPPSAAPSPLTGNWLLAGQLAPFPGPQAGMSLSSALVVNGTQVYAFGFLQVQCSAGGFGTSFGLSGQIAADGTFTLTAPALPGAPIPTEQISISGSQPPAAGANWSGNYSVTATSSANAPSCTFTQTSAFTATALAPLTGVYGGPSSRFAGSQNGLGANVTFALNLDQGMELTGSPTLLHPTAAGSIAATPLPLAATLTVTGSPCFTSGSTTSRSSADFVGGSFFGVVLTMNDGSQMSLSGFINDVAEDGTSVFYAIQGGNCDKQGGETVLTRS